MDLMELMSSRIDLILDGAGPGMKVLLMDAETTTSVSLSCPQSRIMKREVFLFENLHSRAAAKNLGYLKCVVLARPTSENVRLLAREVASPRYGSYHIYFTNRVKRADLKALAEADANEVVADLKEIPSDLLALESHVFATGVKRPVRNLQWNKEEAALQRCLDGLKSLLMSLKTAGQTHICYMKESPVCEELANTVHQQLADDDVHEASSNSRRGNAGSATLLILDRRIDPVTPLLNQWTYQAMIHELIGTKNNTVDMTDREDVPDEMKHVTLSADSDEFYRHNMYANFGEIGQTIKTLVQNFQEKVKGHQKLDSIGDIKDFVSSYPEFKKMSGTVSKHVALVGELSKEVRIHSLLEVSECEQTIACGMEKENSVQKLQQILALQNLRPKDALRLVALFTIRYGREVERNLDLICRSVKGVPKKEVYDTILRTGKYGRVKSKFLFEDKMNPFTTNFLKGLKGADNVYTQHRPLLTKDILPDILKCKARADLSYLTPGHYGVVDASKKIVIFVVGGITYEETRAVYNLNKEQGSNIIIGGTSVLNYDQFMDEMFVATATGGEAV